MRGLARTETHAKRWHTKMIGTSRSMTYFFCSTCQRPQPRRHLCDPVLQQSKDPEYTNAVYDRILSP
eukprot:12277101-Karenia_brevis.AAC.1